MLFYNRSDVGQNVAHLDNSMRDYVLTKECRRKFISDYFGFEFGDTHVPENMCCDNCKAVEQVEDIVPSRTEELVTTAIQTQQATEMLRKYFNAENSTVEGALLPQLVTGLTDSLIETVSSSLKYRDPEVVSSEFPHLRSGYSQNIAKILSFVGETQQLVGPSVTD